MNQDLFDWLNSQTVSRDKGLLIAPLAEILPSQNENDDSESNQPETESATNFYDIDNAIGESESSQQNENEYPETESAINFQPDDDTEQEQTHEWQERATGFTLSLDEPPPELWTRINDDDPDPEYEPTDSLQGAAYVQIHGRNFTERLHHTLRTRQAKKERMQSGSDDDDSDGAISRMRNVAVMLCSLLVMAFGLSCIALYFVWRGTPEGIRKSVRNAETHIEEIAKVSQDKQISMTQSRDIQTRITPKEKPKSDKKTRTAKTFTDYLNDGNYAYNIGMYNRAVINFWNAQKIDGHDIRPYLGLSACYRKKGMYADAHFVIEEARRLFGRSPAVDMAVYFLREAQRK